MIKLNDISYRYRRSTVNALSNVSFSIDQGIYLLLGENGAGKTTLLHLLSSLLFPTSGDIFIEDCDTRLRLPSMLRSLYFVEENAEMPADTINELVRLHGSVFYPRFDAEMLGENLKAFDIDPLRPFRAMSLGQRKKAIAAYALALRADILLLDEPANGLDIGSRDILRNMMARCVEPGQTVIVSTHTTADIQPLADGIIMLRRGKLLFALSSADLTSRLAFKSFNIPPRDALFSMTDFGRFRSIVPAGPNDSTEIDIHLLYSALQSADADAILNLLNQ